MNIKELRIGNYLSFPVVNGEGTKEYANGKVTGIKQQCVYINGIRVPLRSVLPIPLTEEWVFRFVYSDKDFNEDEYEAEAYQLSDFILLEVSFGDKVFRYKDFVLPYPQYVHQLQNLFFALKGVELRIKEDTV